MSFVASVAHDYDARSTLVNYPILLQNLDAQWSMILTISFLFQIIPNVQM